MSSEEEEAEPRRARAMKLLAKALHRPRTAQQADELSQATAAREELAFLSSLLQLSSREEIAESVRDRISVLSVRTGDSVVHVAPQLRSAPTSSSAALSQETAKSVAPQFDLRKCLEKMRDGDFECVEPGALTPEFWQALLPDMAAIDSHALPGNSPPGEPDASQFTMAKTALLSKGYCVIPPSLPCVDEGNHQDHASDIRLHRLQQGARQLLKLGWPPLFIFMFDAAWELLDGIWAPIRTLLGEDCELDPSAFCWIARHEDMSAESGDECDGDAQAGLNFGMPHRDFTCLDSIGPDGSPRLLSIWVPLTHVTTENGCMMVVPRSLDSHFSKRWAYAHMRPALPGAEDGVTELRFDLQAARPIAPLSPGSIVAWNGNLIHWGTRCSSPEVTPRVSFGFNFLRAGCRLQSGAPPLTQASARILTVPERLAIISRSLLAYSPWFDLTHSIASLRSLCNVKVET